MNRIFITLSTNEAIRGYIEYYDKLMEKIEKKRILKFDRKKAFRMMNFDLGLIPELDLDNASSPADENENEDAKIQTPKPPLRKEDRKDSPAISEYARRPEESKLWQIIRKHESKANSRSGFGSEKINNGTPSSRGSRYEPPASKVEYSLVNASEYIKKN